MAVTLDFDLGNRCSPTGAHVPVTANLLGLGADKHFDYEGGSTIAEPITDEEKEAFCKVLLRVLYAQSSGTFAQRKAAIEAKTIDLTL